MKSKLFLFLILMLALSVEAQKENAKMNSKEISLLLDSLSAALKRWYIYPDKAELISKSIKDKSKTGAYGKLQTRSELAEMIRADMEKAHLDRHMGIMYNPEFEKMLLTVLPDSLQKKENEMELAEEQSHNFYFVKTEFLPGNIGYVRWDGFSEFTKEAQPVYDAAFRFVSNARALIIDMRYNGGGSPDMVNTLLNYFFDKRLPMNHIISHTRDTMKNYTDPKATSFKLTMPVYILTGKRTFSGAEDFTYAMKVAKRAIIVGDTTGGGAHPTGSTPLGQGFVLRIPNARSYHEITGTNWEGTGVYPDVAVAGTDAFDKTKQLIFQDFLSKTKNEDEKRQMQGLVVAMENKLILAKKGRMPFSSEQLQKFCGEYKPIPGLGASPTNLFILLKGNELYRNIPFPPDWKLIPISSTRFIYENDEADRYMEFSISQEGKVTGLSIYYTDRMFSYEKIK